MSNKDLLERLEKYNKTLQGYGDKNPSKSQREELLRKYKEYDKELEGKSYEELLDYYKEAFKDTTDYKLMGPDEAERRFKALEQKKGTKEYSDNLSSVKTDGQIIDTYEELKVEVRELMRSRDMDRAYEQNLKYDQELAASGKDSYEELEHEYKVLYKQLNPDEFPSQFATGRWYRTDLKSNKDLDTLKELKAEVRGLMAERELEKRYADDFQEEGLDTYEELAENYKQVWKLVHKGTPLEDDLEGKNLKDFNHLDTYKELRKQTMRLWEQHDNMPGTPVRIEKVEEVKPEPGASSATEGVVPFGIELAPIVEGEASRLIGGGEASPTEDLRDKAFSGKEEGKGAPDAAAADAAPAATEGVEIEMPPDYVGRASADAAQESNDAPDLVAASPEELGQDAPAADPWAGTPPPGTTEQAGAEAAEGVEIEMPSDPDDAANPGGSEGLGQEHPSGEGPTAAPTEQGGSPFWGVEETGPPAGDVLDYEQATAEGVEIEMPPDYVGQAGTDAGGGETEVPPDPAETETPPEDHFDEVL